MAIKITTEDFIRRANIKHNNKYKYDFVKYLCSRKKVQIICPRHGVFDQTPSSHLAGRGCSECFNTTLTISEFIKKSILIHGDKYNYKNSHYKNSKTKLEIICPIHGSFWQRPDHHYLRGDGCNVCSNNKQLTTDDFIVQSIKIHGNKYDYSQVIYKNNFIKVKIICPRHGLFEQNPYSHYRGHSCIKCKGEENSKRQFMGKERFIDKSIKIHGNKYDYSLVKYKGTKIKVEIICKKHGSFLQKPNNHLNGYGCGKCCSSKGELSIREYLINKDLKFYEQKSFEGCFNKKLLKFDFVVDYNNSLFAIEFQGEQHYKPISFSATSAENANKAFESLLLRDEMKKIFCEHNDGIELLVIPYWDQNNICFLLDNFLGANNENN